MAINLVEEEVDIYQIPSVDFRHSEGQITIGDLHGNAIKLLFTLVKEGILKHFSAEDYQTLVTIYLTPPKDLTRENIKEFNDILAKMEFENKTMLRLIGDELADRGMNDYFTLKILQKLHQHHVPTEIILSNHGIEYVNNYVRYRKHIEPESRFNTTYELHQDYAKSMLNMDYLLDKNLIDQDDVNTCSDIYLNTLKLLSYTLEKDENGHQKILIYSHAPIGLSEIKQLAIFFHIRHEDDTCELLCNTIDCINAKFQAYLKINRMCWNEVAGVDWRSSPRPDWKTYHNPIKFCVWNRKQLYIHRPDSYRNYQIYFSHGHDSEAPLDGNIYNLDTELGKDDRHQGVYKILYSDSMDYLKIKQANKVDERFFEPKEKKKNRESPLRQSSKINDEGPEPYNNMVLS